MLTRMYGENGNVVTGVQSKTRQRLMKDQFGLSNKQATRHSHNMPVSLRETHPNPPAPRRGGACAEHHAYNKLARAGDTPVETYTVTKTRNEGRVTTMKRCDNCAQYGDAMGRVPTDARFPKVAAGATVAAETVKAAIPTAATEHRLDKDTDAAVRRNTAAASIVNNVSE